MTFKRSGKDVWAREVDASGQIQAFYRAVELAEWFGVSLEGAVARVRGVIRRGKEEKG